MKRYNLFGLFFLFHRMNCNPPNYQDKYSCSYKKKVKSCHFHSSFNKIVPIQKQTIKNIKPKKKVLTIISLPINWPKIKLEKDNLPISYNAFPSSFLCVLSSFILFILPFNLKKVNKGGGKNEIYKFSMGI